MPVEVAVSSRTPGLESLQLPDIVVRAGAGAGKTTKLVERVLDIEKKSLLERKKHARIVVTTFTRKATQELKERILAQALASQDPKLIEFARRPSCLHISTIHGVLSLFLSRFSSRMGLSPNMTFLSVSDVRKKAKRVLKSLSTNSKAWENLLAVIDFERLLSALMEFEEHWLQGKVHHVTESELEELAAQKLKTLIQNMNELQLELEQHELNDSWQTFKANLENLNFQLQIKKSVKERCQYLNEQAEGWSFPRTTSKTPESLKILKDTVKDLLGEFTEASLSPAAWQQHQELAQDFESLALAFCERSLEERLRSGQIRMSDLEHLSLKALRENPELGPLFASDWDYWMVDEYQDTSPVQVELLEKLSAKSKAYVVGDPQQSIYLFRGARTEVFEEREQQVKLAGGELVNQMTNYRTWPATLEFFNDVFTELPSKQFKPMQVGYQKDRKPLNDVTIHIETAEEREAEKSIVLSRVRELLQQGVPPEEICVLSRNNAWLEELARGAQQLRIPAQIHGSSLYKERQEIKDGLSLLGFLNNPYNNLLFFQVVRSPWFFIADEELQKLAGEKFAFSIALQKGWASALELEKVLALSREKGVVEAWLRALDERGYFDFYSQIDLSGKKEANLWKLVSMLHTAQRQPRFSVTQFIEKIATPDPEGGGEGDAAPVVEPAKVQMMTVHASKGLQFPHVIFTGLGRRPARPVASFFVCDDHGKWSLSLPDQEDQTMKKSLFSEVVLEDLWQRERKESDRLMYVALTRTEMSLTLVWSKAEKESLAQKLIDLGYSSALEDEVRQHPKYNIRFRKNFSVQHTELDFEKPSASEVRSPFANLQQVQNASIGVTEMIQPQALNSKSNARSSEESFRALTVAKRGTEAHRLFENFKYNENLKIPEDAKAAFKFIQDWKNGELLNLIRSGEAEWGFAIRHEGVLLQGQIDLWAIDRKGRCVVVDYKTGSSAHSEKAFSQLEIYAWALRHMKKADPSQNPLLLVVYPFEGKVLEREARAFSTQLPVKID